MLPIFNEKFYFLNKKLQKYLYKEIVCTCLYIAIHLFYNCMLNLMKKALIDQHVRFSGKTILY